MSDKKIPNYKNSNLETSHSKLILIKNPAICLAIIGFISLMISVYYLPYDLPITGDNANYFWYAIDMSILGEFPQMFSPYEEPSTTTVYPQYRFSNNGWPAFLSLFFSLANFENIQEYMELQRYLTITISIITIIPLYTLCRKFFDKYFSLLGVALFAFQPRIIEDSFFGGNIQLFLFLGVCTLSLFLSKNTRIVYVSFIIAGLFSIVRFEGLLILIPMTIVFFYRFKFSKNTIGKYLFVIGLFLLIVLPMAYIRTETLGDDGLWHHLYAGPEYILNNITSDAPLDITVQETTGTYQLGMGEKLFHFIQTGMQGLSKYFVISLIPTFSFLAPVGIFFLCRKLDYKKIAIIVTLIVFLVPAFYAYSRDIQDLRYFFILFPIFSLVSIFTLRNVFIKSNETGKIFVIFFVGFLFFSTCFLVYFAPDLEHEREALSIAKIIKDTTKKVNSYYPGEKYLIHVKKYTDLEKFPVLSTSLTPPDKFIASIYDVNISISQKADSVEDYIKSAKEDGLTHIVTDGENAIPKILNDIFSNEKNYSYLVKQFDSREHDFKYHIKIYKIDYEKFHVISDKN